MGWTAPVGRYEAVVKMLLAVDGIDLNSKDSFRGWTALSVAAEGGHEEVVKLLLAKDGVDIDSKDFKGRTALRLAAEKWHGAVVRLLQSHSALSYDLSPTSTGPPPRTYLPLHLTRNRKRKP